MTKSDLQFLISCVVVFVAIVYGTKEIESRIDERVMEKYCENIKSNLPEHPVTNEKSDSAGHEVLIKKPE